MNDIPAEGMYPSIEEILTEPVRRKLNARLIADIAERYEKHGLEYISERKLPDGRFINMCMLNDSAQDALEEVADAVFNTIILSMKQRYVGGILRHLVAAYDDLVALREAQLKAAQ